MTFLLSLNKLINENKSMNLTLDESLTEGRLGLLTLSRNGSNGTTKTLQTPCCLLYTSTGSVPHLTPSILSSLPLSSSPHIPLCVSTESLLPMLTTPSSPTPNNNKRFKKDHRVKNNSGLSKSIHPSQAFTNAFSEGLGTYIGLDKTAILVTELRDLKGWLVECGSEGQVPGTGDGILTTTLAGCVSLSFSLTK